MNTQKLVVTNQFMGVKPCEIEIRRFLLLIGEQASGKSTIAKLIYFFQTLPDALYNSAIISLGRGNFDFVSDINLVARGKFLDTFGPTTRSEGFEIKFYYSATNYLTVYQGADKMTYATFENAMGRELGTVMRQFFQTPLGTSAENIFPREKLLKAIYRIFSQENTKFNYIIAGRNTVVAYPDLIGEKVKNEIEKLLEDEVRELDFEKKKRRGNEMLFLDFVDWSEGIRKYFRENGGTFRNIVNNLQHQLQNRDRLEEIAKIADLILKGSYKSNDWGETIMPNGSRVSVALKDASSGQQEVLRILQGLFISMGSQNRREFLVVEEPEAHLYPLAQKELINAFALFLNTIPQGRLLITTHSPYILACVNILLFAHFVSDQVNGQKDKISIPEIFRLDPADFSAYSLGHERVYWRNLKEPDTGLINQNYLDTISEQLGMQFDQLYSLLT